MAAKRWVLAGVLITAAFIATSVLPHAASDDSPAIKFSAPPAASAPPNSRFQLATASGVALLLDTATGQVWKYSPSGPPNSDFFEAKIKEDVFEELSAKLGPTYQGIPLSYWRVLLRDGDEEYTKKALRAVGSIGPRAHAVLPELVGMYVKAAAANKLFDRSDDWIGWAIAQVDPHHDDLRSLLHHKEYAVRRDAALTIGSLGYLDPNSSPWSASNVYRLSQPEDEVETESALKWRLPEDRQAIPVLIEMLRDRYTLQDETTFAEAALAVLASFKGESSAAVSTVQQMLMNDRASTRRMAALALGNIGQAAKDAIPFIRAALKDTEPQVRSAAAEALGGLADRESLPALKALMKDECPAVRESVVGAFGQFKEDAETCVPMLIEVLKTPPSRLTKILRRQGYPDTTIDNFVEVAVVAGAFKALGKLGPAAKDAVPELIRRASSVDDRFAALAYRTLQKIAPEAAGKVSSTAASSPPTAK